MGDFINKAIEATGLLSKSQKTILQYINSFGYKKGVTAHSVQNYTKSSKQAVNNNLNLLIKRDFLYRNKERVFLYYCDQKKIQELLEEYKKCIK